MNVENILKVAQAIEDAAKPDSLTDLGFNMLLWHDEPRYTREADVTGHNCGTVACIGGWTEHILGRRGDGIRAHIHLGLDEADGAELFHPGPIDRWETITPAHAVAVLRHLAETGIVDWTVGAPSEAA